MCNLFRAKGLYLLAAIFLLISVRPSEASRRDTFRAPSPEVLVVVESRGVATDPATGAEVEGTTPEMTAAGEGTPGQAAPRRGLFDFLFKRGGGSHCIDDLVYDVRMIEAARLAERSARGRSINRCWRFVKRALKAAEVVDCYPKTALAKHAAVELPERYGFKQLAVDDPHDAPIGAVLVYGGRGAGHVEIRTETGFVSDHASLNPSRRPLIGVFVKPIEG